MSTTEIPNELKKYQLGLEPTPCDHELSRLPYSIMPFEIVPVSEPGAQPNVSDHHAAHRRDREELISVPFGDVIRSVRMQQVLGPGGSVIDGGKLQDWHMPHQRYHYFYSGPEWLPRTEDEQFQYGVWAGSFYVPPYGLDVSGKKARVRRMDEHQISLLHDGQIRVGSPASLRDLMQQYVVRHGVPHISETDVDRFVNSKKLEVKIELGRKILKEASKVVSEPFQNDFRKEHKRGRVHPRLNPSLPEVVRSKVVEGNQERLVKKLGALLSLQTGVNALQLPT